MHVDIAVLTVRHTSLTCQDMMVVTLCFSLMAINRISLCLGLLTLVTDILSPYTPDILQMFTPAEISALTKVCLLILQLHKCLCVCVCVCV